MSNKVDEIREQMGKLHKKYNPFTDFNFENDLSIEEYVYHLGDWFKGLLNQFKALEDKANEVTEEASSSASAAADSAEAAADSAEAAASSASAAADSAEAAADSEINAKAYADNIADPVSGIVTTWLNTNITEDPTVVIDTSLTVAGAAADAKATGDAITDSTKEKIIYKTRPGYINVTGTHVGAGAETQEVYTNKLPCFTGDTVTYSFVWENREAKWAAVGFFDENVRFISRSPALFSGTLTSYSGTFTIPANAYYYAVSWRTYGNCTAEFSYTGSVYAIRNRIDKGLVYESTCGEWDTGNMNPDQYTNNEVVIAIGFRPITDFIPVKHGKIFVKKDSAYTSELYCQIAQYDEGKNRLENIAFSILNHSKLFELSPDAAYVRLIFDGHVQPNSSDSPTPAAIIPYVSWYTNYWDEALTPIIVGKTLPSWDMENMTFTIPNDCIFLKQGKAVRPSVLIGASNDTVLNIPTNSSAQKLYFNLSTNEYVWHLWSDVISYPDDLILVAVFRTNQGYSSVGSIAITCPYEIDGKAWP